MGYPQRGPLFALCPARCREISEAVTEAFESYPFVIQEEDVGVVMALVLACQETPGDALKALAEAMEKKSLDRLNEVSARKFTQKEFDEEREVLDKLSGGRFALGFKKCPSVGAPVEGVERVRVEWRFPVKEGMLDVSVFLKKVDGKWKVQDRRVDLNTRDPVETASGKAKESPSDLYGTLIVALEKKEYGQIPGLLKKNLAERLTGEQLQQAVQREEERCKGHWVEGLKRVPPPSEVDEVLTQVTVWIEYESKDGTVKPKVEFVREGGAWRFGELEVKLSKRKEGE